MAFLNPILLLGMLGVSVPIIIHLLNRRQIRRVPWAAMRFLQASVENNQQRMRIEDLLLLLLRCLLILLLALALARPAIKAASSVFGQPAAATLLIVDSSYSMSQTTGAASRFDVARRAVGQIIESVPPGSSVAIWLGSDSVTPVVAEPTRDLSLARRTVDDLRPSDRATDLLPAVKQGIAMLKRQQAAAKDLFVVTDGQRLGFRQLAAIRQELDAARADAQPIRTTFVLVDQPEDANLGVTSMVQASGVSAIDRPLRFSAVVTNYGTEPARNVRVTLRLLSSDPSQRAVGAGASVGGGPVDDATIDLIEPGASKAISLFGRLKTDGFYAVTAAIAPDSLPADDRRTVVVRGTKRVKVLLVDGDPGRETRDAETFFLRALFAASGTDTQPRLIDAKVSDAGTMASENLNDYDAVILANVADFSPNTADALAQYVKAGGGLMIFPGDRMRTDFYNEQLGTRVNLLPATFGAPQGEAEAQVRFTTFHDTALEHPIATIWKDPASGRLSSVSVYKYVALNPVAPADRRERPPLTVLKYLNGAPAVVERTVGSGRVIVFSMTADSAWSDLPAKPGVYVPLLYRAIGSIVEKRDESLNLTVGEKFVHRLPIELLGQEAEIRHLDDEQAVAESWRVALVDSQATLSGDPVERAGTYEVRVKDQPPLLFAAQTDAAESNLEPITAEDREQLAQSATVLDARIDSDLATALRQERTGTELVGPLAIVLLILAAAESALAMWFSRSK